MSRSKWSFVALLVLASSSGLAVAQGAAPPPGTIAEEVISENDGGADSPDLAVAAESQPALAAEVDEAPSVEPPAAEENPFADMIGMTQKELRKKWGRPSPNSPGTNGDGVYFYDIEPDVMVVVVIRDKKSLQNPSLSADRLNRSVVIEYPVGQVRPSRIEAKFTTEETPKCSVT